MDIFDVLTLIGGLCLFLFGMNTMGTALEKRAGGGLKSLLERMTSRRLTGFLVGLGVTAVIQSSSATTVMVVGFVNSGIMTLKQAIGVIMGANIGTTVTAWLLSLTGISGSNIVLQLLKPTSFTPVLALVGIIFMMFCKSGKKKDTGLILLGFATLMYGMDIMSGAVAGLREVEGFRNLLMMFTNPILGVLAGAVLTAILQSSSASVGILQALASTGQVAFGAAVPIIMGQNIGTCVTALISCVGTNKNARRAAVVHLAFNIIGTIVWLTVFTLVRYLTPITIFEGSASAFSIAVAHTVFNVLTTAMMYPLSGLLEKLACLVVRDKKETSDGDTIQLDERLMVTPAIALEHCRRVAQTMAEAAFTAVRTAIDNLREFDKEKVALVEKLENSTDESEDALGTYLIKLGSYPMNLDDNNASAKLLHSIGDFERMADHAVNMTQSALEMRDKGVVFSETARKELDIMTAAVEEIADMSLRCFIDDDVALAEKVEPLEEVVDTLKEQLRSRHILRLQRGHCSAEAGFIWSDLLTDLERVADHCSNIAGCVVEMSRSAMGLHEYVNTLRAGNDDFMNSYRDYARKYALMEE